MTRPPKPEAPRFREAQHFRQWWLWLLLLPVSGVSWYAVIRQVLLGQPWSDRPAPDVVILLIWLLSGVGLPLLFLGLRLVTEIRADGIYLRFIPFHLRWQRLPFEELESCAARPYRPIVEYGGWGIRYGFKGKAYNVSGNRGVQLVFKNGRRLLIGSQRADELAALIQARLH